MAGTKKDAFATDLLELIFTNANIANIGDSTGLRGSATAGNFHIALYTTAPTASTEGTETVYTNYARVAVARSGAGWTVSGNNCYNTAAITFNQCGATGATLCAFSINIGGTENDDDAIYWGDLTSNLAVSSGITPEFAVGDLDVYED
jgi:hypothetical protein